MFGGESTGIFFVLMCSKLIELQPSAQRFKELPRSLNANRSHPPPCLDPVRDLDLTHLAMRTRSALTGPGALAPTQVPAQDRRPRDCVSSCLLQFSYHLKKKKKQKQKLKGSPIFFLVESFQSVNSIPRKLKIKCTFTFYLT